MKNVLLIGLGRFGRHLAMQLSELGHQVMAVDRDEERVNECMPFVTNAQIGDSTRVDFLRSLGVATMMSATSPSAEISRTRWKRRRCSRSWGKICGVPRRAGCTGKVSAAQRRGRGDIPGKAAGEVGGHPLHRQPYFRAT